MLVNDPGRCLVSDGLAGAGWAAGWIASAGLPGTNVVGFGRRLSWTTWTTGTPAARAQARRSAIRSTARGPVGQDDLADRREVLLLGVDDEERGLLHRGASLSGGAAARAHATMPPRWTTRSGSAAAAASRARIPGLRRSREPPAAGRPIPARAAGVVR